MKRTLVLALLASCYAVSCRAAEYESPAALASELRRLQSSIMETTAAEISRALPDAWDVQTPEGNYSISAAPLRKLLSSSPAGAQAWLNHLATQLAEYGAQRATGPNARAKLQAILARPEFQGNGPPNAWDRFRERVEAWIARWLKRLFVFAGQHPTSFYALFWIVLLAAVGLAGFFVFRLWNRDTYRLNLSGSPAPAPIRTWQRWLEAARTAANGGDLRRAIQCAYWAAIARLQESGALRPDSTRTPREYLRALSDPAVNPMRTLTGHLERFWFGRATAAPDDFSTCLGCLEALGCKVD